MAHIDFKSTGKTHTFKGILADGAQDRIRIQGAVGAIAWRITKFQVMPPSPDTNVESTIKIYREEQDSIVNTIDFSEDELLAAAVLNFSSSYLYGPEPIIYFNTALFVRNIYISHRIADVDASVNYYIELEEVRVSAAGMSQLAVAAARRGTLAGA